MCGHLIDMGENDSAQKLRAIPMTGKEDIKYLASDGAMA